MRRIPDIKNSGLNFKDLAESDENMGQVRKSAEKIRALLESTFMIQDQISFNTCVKCPEPCCSVATIWYDVKDIIFIASLRMDMPETQPRSDSDICVYYSPLKGCKIERIRRPFICNYFICGTQRNYLRKYEVELYDKLDLILFKVKNLRKLMEEQYLKNKNVDGKCLF